MSKTQIPNEIIEKLCVARLTSYEYGIVLALCRKTYGWHKKFDRISLSQFAKITGIPSTHCSRTISSLVKKRIVTKVDSEIGLNEDISAWLLPNQVLPNQVLPNQVTPITWLGNPLLPNQVSQLLPNQVDTKETITKETIQKKERAPDFEKKTRLWGEFWNLYPNKVNKSKANQIFMKLTGEDAELAVAALPKQKEQPQWTKDGGLFIPHPTTWLNGRRWEDLPVEKPLEQQMQELGLIMFKAKHGKELAMKYAKYSNI